MMMKVLHLEKEEHYATIAKVILSKSDQEVEYVRVVTNEECAEALARGDVDVLLASHPDSLLSIHRQHPETPLILWTAREDQSASLQAPGFEIWDIISRSEASRLLVSVARAAEHKRLKAHGAVVEHELAQAKDVLFKCQKSITVGRLLGAIVHEINNPLEAVANLIYFAKKNASNSELVVSTLDMAEMELHRVGHITKQTLGFHRDSRDLQDVSVSEVMENALALFAVRILQQKIEVIRQYRAEGRVVVHPGELRQALANLVSNAVDAMPTGGRLTLRIQERHGAQRRICVTVADTGTGMSRGDSRRIGELFFTTKGETGTGLGMWVTRQLIEKYDASLRAYSSTQPTRSGTVVQICFPKTASSPGF